MTKTEQQKRFENALATHMPGWKPCLDVDDAGDYVSIGTGEVWDGFQLGEASSLERAAKVCDLFALHHADNYKEEGGKFIEGQSAGADECAAAIRALAQEDV